MALERHDLRVVHAAWVKDAIERIRGEQRSIVDTYRFYEREAEAAVRNDGLADRAAEEEQRFKVQLRDRSTQMHLLENIAERDDVLQMSHPVRILTSGPERRAACSFWAGGQWRMSDRVAWWNEYTEETPVVIGHYWRAFSPTTRLEDNHGKMDIFANVDPMGWMGQRHNVFCVDYSIGKRYVERKGGKTAFATGLAALRWPQRELWGEHGRITPAQ